MSWRYSSVSVSSGRAFPYPNYNDYARAGYQEAGQKKGLTGQKSPTIYWELFFAD
jgi:hypothetical protein